MGIIKDVFSGKALPKDIHEYIMYGKDETDNRDKGTGLLHLVL